MRTLKITIDWWLYLLLIALIATGLLAIFSATYRPDQAYSLFFKKQILGGASGLLIFLFFSYADYRTLCRWGHVAYYFLLGLLILTMCKGVVGMGAQRWIDIGLLRFQPSELSKLLYPAFLVYYLSCKKNFPLLTLRDFIQPLFFLLITFFLVVKQPDLGTAVIIAIMGISMMWLAGLSKKFLIGIGLCLIITAPLSWHLLKPFQKKRILVFLGYGSQHNERYHIEQSKIAIGSGGVLGKGYLQGSQNRGMFLPANQTDFVFSVVAEEFGFVGSVALLLLLFFLSGYLLQRIILITNPSAQLLATGLLLHILISILINLAMVCGLLPVVGIPLPLVSYGVSNLWITLASFGWINGIIKQRSAIGPIA